METYHNHLKKLKKLAIIGSGDLGQQIAYHAKTDGHYEPVGFFDDFESPGTIKHELPVLGKTSVVQPTYDIGGFDVLMIGIGYNHMDKRASFFQLFKDKIPFGNVIHSSTYQDKSCKIGEGIFIYPGCTIDMRAKIGDNALINAGCMIAHDSEIGAHSFLAPAVKIAGFVKLEERVMLGIGTVIIDNLRIASSVRTGAGAVVVKDLTEPGLYLGVPAKFRKGL